MDQEDFENFRVEALYRDVLGEFSFFKNSTSKVACPHWIVPTPNLNSQPSSQHVPVDSRFKFEVERPRPFLPPSNVNPASLKEGDPLELIVLEKEKWEYELHSLIRLARKGKKWADCQKHGLTTIKVKKKDAEKPIYTVNTYADVAKHVATDPHPYFSGNYNWLASGGCITHCFINGEKYILSPRGKSMDALCVSPLAQHGDTQQALQISLSEGQRTYQVVASSGETRVIAGIRQSKVCSIVTLKQGSKKPISARTLLEIQDKDGVFTCIDLNGFDDNQFCTLDSDLCLKLWDMTTSSCSATADSLASVNESKESSWGFVKFGCNSPEIFVLNRSKVFLKDHRMSLSENSLEFCPSAILDDCEELTLLLNSSLPSLVYIATSHCLLSLDLRQGWTQRWTHLLQAPPMYGSTYYDSRKAEEVVVLSSSIPDDTIAIVNKWVQEKPQSDIIPVSLPSLGDSLLLARSRGQCLGPNFRKRLGMATAGLTLLPLEDSMSFSSFKATSIGDVFSQRFVCASTPSNVDRPLNAEDKIAADVQAWMEWEQAHEDICANNLPDLICPASTHDAIFNCIKAPMRKDKDRLAAVKNWHKTFPPNIQIDDMPSSSNISEILCDLSSYKDLMAGVLLQAWDSEGLTSLPESRNYVEHWLADSVTSSDRILSDEEDADSAVNKASPVRRPRLMSSYDQRSEQAKNELDCFQFKIPSTPASSRSNKKMKRESVGF